MELSLTVNGQRHQVDVEPRVLLVDLLRESLGFTGTKVGCESGRCGVCTVLLNGKGTKSCLTLAVQAADAEITTIEGVSSQAGLNPIQDAFRETHGVQCGFCTPGMVMSVTELLQRTPHPSEVEIRSWLDGHLCRCTGYQNIVRAVQHAAEHLR